MNSIGYCQAMAASSPSSNDVLFEKGLRAYNRPGNIHYRQVIRDKALEYNLATTHYEKDEIAYSVLPLIPGRFLKQKDGDYHVVDQKVVITKIKQAIRDCKKNIPVEITSYTNQEINSKPLDFRPNLDQPTSTQHRKDLNKIPVQPTSNINQEINSEPSDFRPNPDQPTNALSRKDLNKLLDICKNLSP
jgi:hypothetical protein